MQWTFRFGCRVFLLALLSTAPSLLAEEPEFVKGMAPVEHGELYYELAGDGSPIVFIHGGQMDSRIWDDQFVAFAEYYKVVRYDVRGYGNSTQPTMPYANTDDLHRLLIHLNLERVTLVGLSLGGRIAIDFTIIHPEQVNALVLVAPGLSGFTWSEEQRHRLWQIIVVARDEGFAAASELWLRDPYMAPAMENPTISPKIQRLVRENSHVWLMNPLLERWLDPPAVGRLSDILVPTLVIVGDRDVPDIQKICSQLGREISGARKKIVANAGHIVNMEQVEYFNELVGEFLGELDFR